MICKNTLIRRALDHVDNTELEAAKLEYNVTHRGYMKGEKYINIDIPFDPAVRDADDISVNLTPDDAIKWAQAIIQSANEIKGEDGDNRYETLFNKVENFVGKNPTSAPSDLVEFIEDEKNSPWN